MSIILVIAPHPDDEILGCGGTLLRHIAEGNTVHWLIVTCMHEQHGYDHDTIQYRSRQIAQVYKATGFAACHELGLPTTRLDTLPMGDIITALGDVVNAVHPDTLYIPYVDDIHTDHGIVATAAKACSKWFRYPGVRRIYGYETPSETDFSLSPHGSGMPVQRYVDISTYLEKKLEILTLYENELDDFPFPRSRDAIIALAKVRGAAAGCQAAEAFQVIKEIV
ncbi:MAG: PIG-L family deacetylase [Gammaproteobacteria bacterium]|nr:PIG-L family deacetylase [Gammaproteobacteria bacterium]